MTRTSFGGNTGVNRRSVAVASDRPSFQRPDRRHGSAKPAARLQIDEATPSHRGGDHPRDGGGPHVGSDPRAAHRAGQTPALRPFAGSASTLRTNPPPHGPATPAPCPARPAAHARRRAGSFHPAFSGLFAIPRPPHRHPERPVDRIAPASPPPSPELPLAAGDSMVSDASAARERNARRGPERPSPGRA